MKRSNRAQALRTYGHLYRRHLDAGADSCFYCGAPRECLDHRPPLAMLDVIGPVGMREAAIPLVLLPCCHECNRRLGDIALPTAEDALAHLLGKIESEYERRHSLWADDEIGQMSPMFQTMIQARKAQLSAMLARVRHMQERSLDSHLMPVYLPPDDDDAL